MNPEIIARIAHETNRAYCQTIGDNSQLPWEEAPDWQKKSAINGVIFHLNALRSGEEAKPSASHENWLTQKLFDGWKYGAVKNETKKEHPYFVPYEELTVEQRRKDYLFAAIVSACYRCQPTKQSVPSKQ